MKEVIGIIIEALWNIICYLLKGIGVVVIFIFKGVWRVCVWCWEYIVLLWKTPTTVSGALDRRFKSARLIEEKNRGCGCVIIVICIIAIIIGKLKPNEAKSDCDDGSTTNIIEKDITQKEKKKLEVNIVNTGDSMGGVDDTIILTNGWRDEIDSTSNFRNNSLQEDSITKLEHINTQIDYLQLIEDDDIE
jgi:hypothetical protein